jgi:hypothetical protein
MWEKTVPNLISNAFKYTFEGDATVTLKPTAVRSCHFKTWESACRQQTWHASSRGSIILPARGAEPVKAQESGWLCSRSP